MTDGFEGRVDGELSAVLVPAEMFNGPRPVRVDLRVLLCRACATPPCHPIAADGDADAQDGLPCLPGRRAHNPQPV